MLRNIPTLGGVTATLLLVEVLRQRRSCPKRHRELVDLMRYHGGHTNQETLLKAASNTAAGPSPLPLGLLTEAHGLDPLPLIPTKYDQQTGRQVTRQFRSQCRIPLSLSRLSSKLFLRSLQSFPLFPRRFTPQG